MKSFFPKFFSEISLASQFRSETQLQNLINYKIKDIRETAFDKTFSITLR